ncbi:MAG: molybdopterin molybdotransferase MoeA [Verrucomicrobiae bacterium]|nr:molybdopterin molybdotransferase MoeA [Verrucomicrobiae bacterium]
MLTTADALERILAKTPQLPTSEVALDAGLGRFLAQPMQAHLSLPRFDQSSMDGYAVAEDGCGKRAEGSCLRVISEIAAGTEAKVPVSAGQAVRVFTGAPVPQGTAAVLMQEDVTAHPDSTITVNIAAEPGEFIRRAGADVSAGQRLAESGQRITPALLAILATQGWAKIVVGGVPQVGILSTGDELVSPGHPLPSAASIYNSNGPMLQALVKSAGGDCVRVEHGRDDLAALTDSLRSLSDQCDIIIVSGGVSVGDHDHVRPAMEQAGFEMDFWKVRMKPGKPLAFGVDPVHGRVAFGLPGNPVSAFVTFWLFVFPALRKMMGASGADLSLPAVNVRAATTIDNKGDRAHWFRGRVSGAHFEPLGLQESHALFSLSKANALVCVEPETTVSEGAAVDAWLLP